MRTRVDPAASLLALWLAAATAAWAHSPAESSHAHGASGKAPEQLGRVSFENSCAAAVQPRFERAMALLHSFWWREGEQAFRQVLEHDPDCAVATWGLAAILIGNPFAGGPSAAQIVQAQQAIERGRAIGAKTERERMFIEAVAQYFGGAPERAHAARMQSLADAVEGVARRFPDDDEAQIFAALYRTVTQDPTEQSFASALRAAAVLEAQSRKHPDHPGAAHYLIHSYDYPPIAARGLEAARRYAEIAPSAPHALHMPSHIFTRVGAWQDSVASNLRSARVAEAEGDLEDQLHAMDYLAYAYLQLAQDAAAQRVVEGARHVPRSASPGLGEAYARAAMPARHAIERGAWKEAAQLQVQPTRFAFVDAFTHAARAIGAARSADAAAAQRDADALARIVDALRAARNAYWATEVEVQRLGASAWIAFARGHREAAIDLMRAAADLEDTSEKHGVSPGRLVPARELLGDMLLESGQPAEALAQYERAQVRDPNRFRSLHGAGQAAAQAGRRDRARHHFERLRDMADPGAQRPELEHARRHLASP